MKHRMERNQIGPRPGEEKVNFGNAQQGFVLVWALVLMVLVIVLSMGAFYVSTLSRSVSEKAFFGGVLNFIMKSQNLWNFWYVNCLVEDGTAVGNKSLTMKEFSHLTANSSRFEVSYGFGRLSQSDNRQSLNFSQISVFTNEKEGEEVNFLPPIFFDGVNDLPEKTGLQTLRLEYGNHSISQGDVFREIACYYKTYGVVSNYFVPRSLGGNFSVFVKPEKNELGDVVSGSTIKGSDVVDSFFYSQYIVRFFPITSFTFYHPYNGKPVFTRIGNDSRFYHEGARFINNPPNGNEILSLSYPFSSGRFGLPEGIGRIVLNISGEPGSLYQGIKKEYIVDGGSKEVGFLSNYGYLNLGFKRWNGIVRGQSRLLEGTYNPNYFGNNSFLDRSRFVSYQREYVPFTPNATDSRNLLQRFYRNCDYVIIVTPGSGGNYSMTIEKREKGGKRILNQNDEDYKYFASVSSFQTGNRSIVRVGNGTSTGVSTRRQSVFTMDFNNGDKNKFLRNRHSLSLFVYSLTENFTVSLKLDDSDGMGFDEKGLVYDEVPNRRGLTFVTPHPVLIEGDFNSNGMSYNEEDNYFGFPVLLVSPYFICVAPGNSTNLSFSWNCGIITNFVEDKSPAIFKLRSDGSKGLSLRIEGSLILWDSYLEGVENEVKYFVPVEVVPSDLLINGKVYPPLTPVVANVSNGMVYPGKYLLFATEED